MGKRIAYVIILGSILIPVVLKRELNEISILSVILFVSIFSFIILTAIQLGLDGTKYNSDFDFREAEVFYEDYMAPKIKIDLIKGISIILVSYSCQ
jgi:amino acid permease